MASDLTDEHLFRLKATESSLQSIVADIKALKEAVLLLATNREDVRKILETTDNHKPR
jgi:hypothetical protein